MSEIVFDYSKLNDHQRSLLDGMDEQGRARFDEKPDAEKYAIMATYTGKIENLLASAQGPDKAQFVPSSKACRIIMGHIRDTLPGEFRFDDIWPFVKDLLESGAITGFIDRHTIDPISLANKDNYEALRHGDDLRLPGIERDNRSLGGIGREIEAYYDGPVYFELGELNSALAESKPAFVDDGEFDSEPDEPTNADEAPPKASARAGIGGPNKMPYRVAIAMASYFIYNKPRDSFEAIFDKVKDFWANANEKSSGDDARLKYLLTPVYDILHAELYEKPNSEIEEMAISFVKQDLKKSQKRITNVRSKAPRATRQDQTNQHD